MLRTAAADERRHVGLCRLLASGPLETPTALKAIAPKDAGVRDAVLYELIAAGCIAETESVATLTVLLKHDLRPDIERTVREIAADEVRHAKLGWAHLAREAAARPLGFVGGWIPTMLAATAGEGFAEGADGDAAPEDLLTLGVLPLSQKREVFKAVLEDAVLPGFGRFGIELLPAREWLARF